MLIVETYQNSDPTGLPVLSRRIERLGESTEECVKDVKCLIPGQLNVYADKFLEGNADYQFAFTMFEATRIPEDWVKTINKKVGHVLVPHDYSRQAFIDSGVTRPVSVVPLAYERYERTKPYIAPKRDETMIIGILGVPVARKNVEMFIDAIAEANVRGANVVVHMHAPYMAYKGHMREFMNKKFVDVSTGVKTKDELREWFSSIHAYAFPSSGEGWSFTPREAMHMGIPTIVSDITAHDDIVDSDTVISIPTCGDKPAFYEFLRGNLGEWKRIRKEDMVNAILEARERIGKDDALTEGASQFVQSSYSWDEVLNNIRMHVEPKRIIVCPSYGTKCGIAEYTKKMVSHMPDTIVVRTIEEAAKYARTGNIEDIHVQHEFSFFRTGVFAHQLAKIKDVQKTVTIHTMGNETMMNAILEPFDRKFVLGSAMKNIAPKDVQLLKMPGNEPDHIESDINGPVGTYGFIHPQKGYKHVAEATKIAKKRYKVLGSLRPQNPEWGESLKQAHVDHTDEFLSWARIRKELAGCSMLVFYYDPIKYSYASASIMEAATLGIPIITSDSGVFDDLSECTLQVPSQDPEALAEAIRTLCSDKEERERLVSKMDDYLEEHSWQKTVQQFL